jgi:lipopolysaccharide transport system permease protein
MNSQSPPKKITIDGSISATRYWHELKEFRELIYFLTWRDILVRYKQTVIGLLWAVMRPLLLMCVLTLVFGRLANLSQDESTPYPLLVLAGLLPWQFFAATLADSSESFFKNQSLISKLYFPRLIIPISTSAMIFLDFIVSLGLLGIAMALYKFLPSINCLFLPCYILQLVILSFGTNLWISALTIKFRDIRILIPFAVQFGLYVTPVGFSSSIIPEAWRIVYGLNPMVGIIDGFRWSLLGEASLYWPTQLLSLSLTLAIFVSGLFFFQKSERNFADNL